MITLPGLKDQFSRNYEAFAGPLRTNFEEAQIEAIFKVSYFNRLHIPNNRLTHNQTECSDAGVM